MSNLIPRTVDAFLDAMDDDPRPRSPRYVRRATNREIGRGLVQATRAQADTYVAHTRVEGASFVARLGMNRVAELAAEELRYLKATPSRAAAARYRMIGDAFAALVASEVIELGCDL